MSGHEADIDCAQRAEAAAYVLGALEPLQAEGYREHLDRCAACRAEFGDLQVAANMLPATAPEIQVPEALLRRVMSTVRSEAELLNAAGPQADRPEPARTRWRTRRLALSAAAALTAALAATIVLASGSPSSQGVTTALVAAGAPAGHAQLRQDGARTELTLSGIPQPPAGKIYEVWVARAGAAPQATDALFTVTTAGSASVGVPGSLHGIQQVMVTAEPLGGSRHPTSPPIITATLSPS
jgi:anti-sigma-K factor RskA